MGVSRKPPQGTFDETTGREQIDIVTPALVSSVDRYGNTSLQVEAGPEVMSTVQHQRRVEKLLENIIHLLEGM